MFLKQPMRYIIPILAFCAVGCQTDFMGFPSPTSTTTPTPEQVKYCREVMYINTDLELEPLGFYLQQGMDDLIRFKFTAKTDDPSKLFDSALVDATKFRTDVSMFALDPDAAEEWWDISSQTLTGEKFTVPPPQSQGTRGLNIGYTENGDGTLTVYVLWHET